jgi:hypothetical protein
MDARAMTHLTLEPQVPLAVWASLAVAALALLAWYGFDVRRRLPRGRRIAVLALMACALALPLGLLLNPTWHERLPPPEGKPVLKVLIDTSASMATTDGASQQSRFGEARRLAQALHDKLAGRYDVQLQEFAAAAGPTDLPALAAAEPDGLSTDLAAALAGSLGSDVPQGQAVVILSDGIHNAGGGEAAVLEAASRAKAVAAPLLVKTLGGDTVVADLAVEVRSPQELAFVGQQVSVQVELQPQGVAGRTVTARLTQDDKEIDHREVTLADQAALVEFPVKHDRSGVFRYEVRVDPVEGEVTPANNRAAYVLRVVDEPIRVLLLEGKPYWDTKFLVRTLASDSSIELVSVVRLAEGRFLQRTLKRKPPETSAAKPDRAEPAAADTVAVELATENPGGEGQPAINTRPETWQVLNRAESLLGDPANLAKFQIVVLGRDAEAYLSDDALAAIKRWLARDGGSLVCFRGSPTVQVTQRLGALLPMRGSAARESRFRMRLTEVGKDLRWVPASAGSDVFEQMPSLATRSESASTQPLAVVWAVGQSAEGDTPVVAAMPYGTGRVVVLEGAGMWRWAFMAPKYERHEAVYVALWQSLTRWLVSNTGLLPTEKWALRADKIRFFAGETATASLLVRETALAAGPPAVELLGEANSEPHTVLPVPVGDEPGAYRVVFGKLPAGRYETRIVGAAAADTSARSLFEVRSNVDEVVHVAANRQLMQRLAEVSGGAVLETASPDEIAARMDRLLGRLRPEQVRDTPAWDRWWVLVGMFAVWAVSWGLRRNSGLV